MPGTQPTVEIAVRRWVTPRSGSALAGGEDGVDVHRRLPHAHEDDVVDRLQAAEVERLVEDLVGAQVAAELHLAGGAEGAGQRAAGLRGEADRAAPVAVAHQHRLDRPPVAGVEERLDRAVVGLRLGLEAQGRERHGGGEALAQRRGQIRHLLVGARRRAPPTPRPGRRGSRARRPRRGRSESARGPSGECRERRAAELDSSRMSGQAERAERFLALHSDERPLLLPNPWDLGSGEAVRARWASRRWRRPAPASR